jgi:hypothetical protein
MLASRRALRELRCKHLRTPAVRRQSVKPESHEKRDPQNPSDAKSKNLSALDTATYSQLTLITPSLCTNLVSESYVFTYTSSTIEIEQLLLERGVHPSSEPAFLAKCHPSRPVRQMYRASHSARPPPLIMRPKVEIPNEPSPISEHSTPGATGLLALSFPFRLLGVYPRHLPLSCLIPQPAEARRQTPNSPLLRKTGVTRRRRPPK